MMITVEAIKPLVWSIPSTAADHDYQAVVWVDTPNGEPVKRPVFYKTGKAYVGYTKTAAPQDIASDAARRSEEHELAKREGREPAYVSRIFSEGGVAMVHEPGSGPFQIPEAQAKDWAERGLVKILGPAADMASEIAPKRKSLTPARA